MDTLNEFLHGHATFLGGYLGSLSEAKDRLRAYREYLGMSLEEVGAHYGIAGSTWSYAETGAKGISPKILDPLSRTPPPPGKKQVVISWLLTGEGDMLPGTISGRGELPAMRFSAVGDAASPYLPTPGFPEKQIVRATELVVDMMGGGNLSPYKLGGYISTVAEMLVLGETEEAIRDLLGPPIRSLAYSEARRPPQPGPGTH